MPFETTRGPITRGELAKRSGCHLETVRYYEKIDLLPPPERSAGGHRLYRREDQKRLRFILRGRELGSVHQYDGKLLAPIAGYEVVGTPAIAHDPGQLAQELIAGGMAVAVVIGLEVIDIDHQQ